MKLNKIATAVSISLAALALTACGSDKKASKPSTPSVQPSKPDTSAAEKEKEANIKALTKAAQEAGLTAENAKKLAEANPTVIATSDKFKDLVKAALDEQKKANNNPGAGANQANNPTSTVITVSNPFIDDINTEKFPTVSTKHYQRHGDSTFDRVSNKTSQGSSGDSTDLKVTNEYLSNFVIGSEADANKKRFAVDSMGEEVYLDTATSKLKKRLLKTPYKSPYFQGSYDVLRRNDKPITVQYVSEDGKLANDVDPTSEDQIIRTLQEENGYGLYKGLDGKKINHGNNIKVRSDVANAVNNNVIATVADDYSKTKYDDEGRTGLVGYTDAKLTYGAEENVYVTKGNSTSLDTSFETRIGNRIHNLDAKGTVALPKTANKLTTRIFGKNYRDYEADANPVNLQKTNNTYVAELDGDKLIGGVRTDKLHDVQYGRLTADIDTLVKDPSPNDKDNVDLIYRQFEVHGAKGSVDTYFYRGTNETTIDEMKKVRENGATLSYYGHAVTYGIGPYAGVASSGKLPTAYSDNKGHTLGNFVKATFDTKTGKVEGSIYNLLSTVGVTNDLSKYKAQDLVEFKGVVSGNTVADGISTKLGATPEQGSFVASFYGKNAQEMGGNVSSITKTAGFGETKWGAVFGATLGQTGGNFSTGQATP